MPVLLLENVIQDYAWGSTKHIANLQGRPTPSSGPEAEVWMGAHPKAPSRVDGRPLGDVIAEDPEAILGSKVASAFDGKLPFLFKFLAAGQPLSIQAHPNLDQAREGFQAENEADIALDDPKRNYKDDNHKPEIICALSDFWALNGFRPIPKILDLLDQAGLTELAQERKSLEENPTSEGLAMFFETLMTLEKTRKLSVLSQLQATALGKKDERAEFDWILRILQIHPGDMGVLCVLLLNLVQLQAGEAMYCAAGDLHAYLDGFGIELMANSDNVLRGGLTVKHVDLPELMKTLTFASGPPNILFPEGGSYPTPAKEFELVPMDVRGGTIKEKARTFSILASAGGKATILSDGGATVLKPGHAVAITAGTDYEVFGAALLYKASANLEALP